MKKLIVSTSLLALLFVSCRTSKVTNYVDDMYANPSEEARLAKLAEQEKAKKESERKKQEEEALLAQRAKDDSNPYYQDSEFNQDDYYDYAYASRLRRFNNPVYGVGYYDNYYTNSYWYNQNPYSYGTSIYSTYNWYNPGFQFNNFGLSYGYNPYGFNTGYFNGYNNGYYSGLYGYGYNPYAYNPYFYNPYGFNNPWNNNGWGYFNSFDVNSQYSKMSFAPRGSNGGGNTPRNTTPGMPVPEEFRQSQRQSFIESVVKKQEESPRFTETIKNRNTVNPSDPATITNGTNPSRNNAGLNNGSGTESNPKKGNGFWNGMFNNNNTTPQTTRSDGNNQANTNEPRKPRDNSGIKGIKDNTIQDNNNNGGFNRSSGNNSGGTNTSPSNTGGGSSPRNTGGGNSRPR